MKEVFLEGKESVLLCLNVYEADKPKAVVQIVHGMCEHQLRYKKLAERLVAEGYTVVTSDLRGHGKSVTDKKYLGYFGKDGLNNLIDDQVRINEYIRNNYKNLKIYMFAHSMGTLIARSFVQENDKLIDKLVMSGAPYYMGIAPIGVLLFKTITAFSGKLNHSEFMKNLIFGQIPKDCRLDNSWLSYNKQNVEDYNNDDNCGFLFTNSGFVVLVKLVENLHNYKNYQVENANMPILFLSGEDDLIVGKKKDLADTVATLVRVGYTNVNSKVYEKMKHEILNENENEKVIKDITDFYER